MQYQKIGREILNRRRKLGMTQQTLAQQAHLSRNYISAIERGEAHNLTLQVLIHLANALELSLLELLAPLTLQPTLTPAPRGIAISESLREFSLKEKLSFETVDTLARIPWPDQEPMTAEEWRSVYDGMRKFV